MSTSTIHMIVWHTTGEVWQRTFHATRAGAEKVMRAARLEPLEDGIWWQDPKDHSQQAMLIEARVGE